MQHSACATVFRRVSDVIIFFVFLQVPNLVFLAVSPEEKESWVNALNVAIIKAKNRVLDEVQAGLFIAIELNMSILCKGV